MTNEGEIKPHIKQEKLSLKIEKADAFGPPYINPLIRLLIYSYIVLVSGNVFMGWTGFQELLYKAGTFEDLCDDSTLEIITIRSNSIIDCPARKAAINNLYCFAFSTNILFCIFSGLVLDFLGQKITFIIGQLTNFVCWILIGLFPKNGLLLRVIMVVIGLTAEAIYLPLTTVALYFPDYKSTILAIMGSIRTLSFFVTSILSFIYLSPSVKKESFKTVAIVFAFVVYFGCFVIGSFIIQKNFFQKNKEKELEKDDQDSKKHQQTDKHCTISLSKVAKLAKDPLFLQTILFTIGASIQMASIEFLNMAQRELLVTSSGDSALNIFRYTQVLTFLPGILIGMTVDKIGAPETLLVLETFVRIKIFNMCVQILLSYVFIGFDKYLTKFLGCGLYLIGGALYLTIIYCYIYENFPPERLGVVLGFILVVCGTLVLLNIPLYKQGLKYAKNTKFYKISWILVGLMAVSLLSTTGVIYIKTRRKRVDLRKVDDNNK